MSDDSMTPEEAACYLAERGLHVTPQTVSRWVVKGRLAWPLTAEVLDRIFPAETAIGDKDEPAG